MARSLSPQQFVAALNDVAKKDLPKAAIDLKRKVFTAAFREVVKDSPKRRGRLRAGWYASNGSPGSEKPEDGRAHYPVPGDERVLGVIAGMKLGETSYVYNNVEYSGYVEFGTSRMSPRGTVRRALERIRSRVR